MLEDPCRQSETTEVAVATVVVSDWAGGSFEIWYYPTNNAIMADFELLQWFHGPETVGNHGVA